MVFRIIFNANIVKKLEILAYAQKIQINNQIKLKIII